MKRMLLLPVCFLLLMILVGCSWAGASTAGRPDAELSVPTSPAASEPGLTPANSETGGSDSPAFVHVEVQPQCPPAWGVSFLLPADWSYEVIQTDDDPTSSVTVSIRPQGADMEGSISFQCSNGFFGVCGTGLEQKDIVFNGHEAWQGFYDGNSVWDFICLKDLRGCAVTNTAQNWYDDFTDEIEQILSTVDFKYVDDKMS